MKICMVCRWMEEQSTVGGVIVWVGSEDRMSGVWRAIVALQSVEMICKEDPVEDFGHGIGWICCAINFEEF
jgi:hypothetical protein